ncbi:MAG: T9SS type A sorting domain-containing protein, partial [Saprospiraceae bacterium]|nr:T9SS type A sorting domain-containing protein [Saprospiraceae bacterium]
HQGYYHLIGETTEVTGNGMIYLKVDTTGSVIKSNKLNTEGKIYTGGGYTYGVIKSIDDRGYYVVTNDHLRKNNATLNIPYVLHVSSELDTVYWRTRFQHPLLFIGDNSMTINNACLLNDSSGIITCGALDTPPFAEPSYGSLFKCSLQGDSLWTRLLQPVGWDSLRAWWLSIESIRTTPYNTIVACGRVSDGQEEVIKGWLLHLDSEGCLVPGCDKIVNSEDIKKGLVQSFTIYPTLIHSDKLYVLSNVQSESSYNLQLTDLQGRIIKSTKLKAIEGIQYVLPVTEDIPNGEYILSITGIDFNQSEKIIIAR